MPGKIVIELPNGNKVLFGGGGRASGLSEVGRGSLREAAAGQFEKALASLGDFVAMMEANVGKLPKRPDKVEMEFRASLTSECDLWIVSGDAEAKLKVTLTWGSDGKA